MAWILPSRCQSAAFYWWRTMMKNWKSWYSKKVKKNVDNIDIWWHSNPYFFNTAFFPPPTNFSIKFFAGRRFFEKDHHFFSLCSSSDRPKMSKIFLIIADLGFQTHTSSKRPAWSLPLRTQSTALYLRSKIQGKTYRYGYFHWNPDSSKFQKW